MKILMIGGTGTISMAITRRFLEQGQELYLLNRGNRSLDLEGIHEIHGDIHDEEAMAKLLKDMKFDAVADFIAFHQTDAERDYRLFAGKTAQYLFISSASAYQTPPADYLISESTPLCNPYWEYSRNKIACEEYLMQMYRENGFPVTIIRPSHTFDERSIPMGIHGDKGSWQIAARMMQGKPVIIHGDGSSLWTMTHNSDFAIGFTGLTGNIHAIGQAVQIMSPESMTWNQIYETVAQALHTELKAVHISSDFLAQADGGRYDYYGSLLGDKACSVVFDMSRLKRLVPEFEPKKTMAQGLRETVEYILAHPEYQKEDPEFDAWCDRVIAARQAALDSLRD